jgi:hypothetical protein
MKTVDENLNTTCASIVSGFGSYANTAELGAKKQQGGKGPRSAGLKSHIRK